MIRAEDRQPSGNPGELHQSQLRELCEALGWQGGTYHQVLAEVRRLAQCTTPGPWEVVTYRNRRTWLVRRGAADGKSVEWMNNAAGRPIRFRSEAAAEAAIARTTGATNDPRT